MKNHKPVRRILAPVALGLCIWLVVPAIAMARALVRFIHGVPGVGTATVDVNTGSGDATLGSIGFAQTTPWRSIRSGSFKWKLVGGGKTLAEGTSTVGDGAYDIVVLAKGAGVTLGIYKAEAGKPGTSLIRVIHGAPELGSPELKVDGKTAVTSLAFAQATPYLSVSPGTHSLAAMAPGNNTPMVVGAHVTLSAGKSYSAIVLGSRGQRVRVVAVVDRGAPLTRPVSQTDPAGSSASGAVIVRSGDSLWAIARKLVGPGASNEAVEHKLVAIWDLNATLIGTGDPNLIFPGQRLRLPR
jgi:Domain of unknown function (DUF4397)/LysM domain